MEDEIHSIKGDNMSVLEIVYKPIIKKEKTVENVPYKKHNYPCEKGCCKNMLSIGLATTSKVNWLIFHYMPRVNITTFDFNDWSEDLTKLWKEERAKKHKI